MIKAIDNLSIFFEDCYKEFSVREYSRKMNISPPTSSKILKDLDKKKLLLMREERGFLLFKINKESKTAKDLSRIYWRHKLKDLTEFLEDELYADSIVLFGSLARLETTNNSDIDLAVFSKSKKDINLEKFEKELGKPIQIFTFESLEKISKELRNNIINGYLFRGYLE